MVTGELPVGVNGLIRRLGQPTMLPGRLARHHLREIHEKRSTLQT